MPITLTTGVLPAGRLRSTASYTTAIPNASVLPNILSSGYYEAKQSFETLIVATPRPYTDYTGIEDSGAVPTSSDNHKCIQTHFCTNMKWRIPIAVVQGSFPFIFRLVGAPVGMVIKQTYTEDDWSDYGWIEWANPTVGTHQFVLLVVDQEGDTGSVSMALNITDDSTTPTNTLHIDTSASPGGDGSFNSPFDSITDVFNQAGLDSKPWVLHDGYSESMPSSFAMQNDEGSALYGDPDSVTRPKVILNDASGPIGSGVGGEINHGLTFLHLELNDAPTGNADPKQIWMFGDYNVAANIHCTKQHLNGTAANDQNNGLLFDGASTNPVLYPVIKNIWLDDYRANGGATDTSSNGGPFKFIDARYGVMEDIKVGTQVGGVQHLAAFKHHTDDCTMRLIRAANVTQTGTGAVLDTGAATGVDEGFTSSRHIIEYCRIRTDSGHQTGIALADNTASDEHTDTVLRRNTLVTTTSFQPINLKSASTASIVYRNNIAVRSSGEAIDSTGTNWTVDKGTTNEEAATYGAVGVGTGLDAEGNLDSADALHGKKGWQVTN